MLCRTRRINEWVVGGRKEKYLHFNQVIAIQRSLSSDAIWDLLPGIYIGSIELMRGGDEDGHSSWRFLSLRGYNSITRIKDLSRSLSLAPSESISPQSSSKLCDLLLETYCLWGLSRSPTKDKHTLVWCAMYTCVLLRSLGGLGGGFAIFLNALRHEKRRRPSDPNKSHLIIYYYIKARHGEGCADEGVALWRDI